jgi:hypothetical protein
MLTMRASGLSAASVEHWLVEDSFHVVDYVGLIVRKQLLGLSNYEECAPLVGEAMQIVGRYYDNAARVAAVKAREDFRQLIEGVPIPFNRGNLTFNPDGTARGADERSVIRHYRMPIGAIGCAIASYCWTKVVALTCGNKRSLDERSDIRGFSFAR